MPSARKNTAPIVKPSPAKKLARMKAKSEAAIPKRRSQRVTEASQSLPNRRSSAKKPKYTEKTDSEGESEDEVDKKNNASADQKTHEPEDELETITRRPRISKDIKPVDKLSNSKEAAPSKVKPVKNEYVVSKERNTRKRSSSKSKADPNAKATEAKSKSKSDRSVRMKDNLEVKLERLEEDAISHPKRQKIMANKITKTSQNLHEDFSDEKTTRDESTSEEDWMDAVTEIKPKAVKGKKSKAEPKKSITKKPKAAAKRIVKPKTPKSTKAPKHTTHDNKNDDIPGTSATMMSDGGDTSDDDDWEDVEELPVPSPHKGPVEVDLGPANKKKSKKDKIIAYAKLLWNRYQKQLHENIHKIELMCLLTHDRLVNEICNSPLLKALAYSLHHAVNFKGNKCNKDSVEKFISVVHRNFTVSSEQIVPTNTFTLVDELSDALQLSTAKCNTHMILVLVAVLRAVGLAVRLCVAWNPIPVRIAHYQKQQRVKRFAAGRSESEAISKKSKHKQKKKEESFSDSESGESSKNNKKSTKKDIKVKSGATTPEYYQFHWLEVYLNVERKWVPYDYASATLDDVSVIRDQLVKPVAYIISYDNSSKVKDVTPRYDPEWLLSTKKVRVEKDWWDEMIKPYHVKETKKTKQEDQEILSSMEDMPMPKSIGGFKDHPQYALERHLLKFEAIYPPSSVPLGYTPKTNEPVYARSCVHTLHTRETWLKDAKQVKRGEEPYKLVKPRPRPGAREKVIEATQPVFGFWQTEEYQPPVAENGKVPRNAYGNVDLFQPQMLPIGCAHIPINGIGKLARKLDIDCAQAMMGWEAHSGYSCPIFDGWVVCEEFEKTLLDSWKDYEAELERKEQEKREKVIYGKWKTLIKGLLIRERLRNRYGTENF